MALCLQQLQRHNIGGENDAQYRQLLTHLSTFHGRLDSVWRGMRWIADVASTARDRQASQSTSTLTLATMFDYKETPSDAQQRQPSENGGVTGNGVLAPMVKLHSIADCDDVDELTDLVQIRLGDTATADMASSLTTQITKLTNGDGSTNSDSVEDLSIIDQLYASMQETWNVSSTTRRASGGQDRRASTDSAASTRTKENHTATTTTTSGGSPVSSDQSAPLASSTSSDR